MPVAALDPQVAATMPTSGRSTDVIAALAQGCCESWKHAVPDPDPRSMGETVSRSRD